MINFFRKIRKKLLSKNKFSKYLIYACGEVVLVVFGILIALQINDWNQNRIDRITEIKYLKSIEKEIISNNIQNQRLIINRLPRKIEGLKLAKKFCENGVIVTDTLEFLTTITYGGVFSGGYNFGNRSSFDEIINTGNIQLIKKDTIKKTINNYYLNLMAFAERATVHSSRFSSFTSELRPFNSENPTFISKADQVEMMQSLKSIAFRKLVDLELSYAYKIRDYIEKIKLMSEHSINLITQELNNEL